MAPRLTVGDSEGGGLTVVSAFSLAPCAAMMEPSITPWRSKRSKRKAATCALSDSDKQKRLQA